jgi:hypothetical protein
MLKENTYLKFLKTFKLEVSIMLLPKLTWKGLEKKARD